MLKVCGNGSIVQLEKDKRPSRCSKWQLRVVVEDDATKQKHTETRTIHGNKTKATAELQAFKDELENTITLDSDVTFKGYVKSWCGKRQQSPKIAKRTSSNEADKLKNMTLHIGDLPMASITATVINGVYAKLKDGQSQSGKPLAGTTILNIHKTMTTMMKDAIRDGVATPGVMDGVLRPKSDTIERTPLTNDQVQSFVDALDSACAIQMLVLTYVTCGLRRSEGVALDWRNMDGPLFYIAQAAEEDASTKVVKRPSSNRAVPIPTTTFLKIEDWKDVQKALLANEGIKQTSKTPIFTTRTGNRYKPHSVTSWWERHREDYKLTCTLHDLRHTYATMLARKNVNIRIAQDLVGDSSLDVLTKIYTHVASEDMKRAVNQLDDIF